MLIPAGLLFPAMLAASAPQQWVQTAEIEAVSFSTNFGEYVAIDGDTLILADPIHTGSFGKARLYEFDPSAPGSWVQKATMSTGANSYASAMDVSGDTAAFVFSQIVLVHERDQGGPGAWGLAATLAFPSYDVAVAGDRIALGGPDIVAIFERDGGGGWNQTALLTEPASFYEYGTSVDISGDVLVVGAPDIYPSYTQKQPGAAFVYRYQVATQTWELEASLFHSEVDGQSVFGSAVSASGDRIAVGAPAYYNGMVHMYLRVGGTWVRDQVLSYPGAFRFGYDLDLDGERVVIGSKAIFPPGRAFVFEHTPEQGWLGSELFHSETPHTYGTAVGISGQRAIAGNSWFNGSVYVFEPVP